MNNPPKTHRTYQTFSVVCPHSGYINNLNWDDRRILAAGSYAIIYEVAPGLVAKVGDVRPNEVKRQAWFAAQNRALPVLDYLPAIFLSQDVAQECCHVHGPRKDMPQFDIWPELIRTGEITCSCDQPLSVILMPKADLPGDVSKEKLLQFAWGTHILCETQIGFSFYDRRASNVARYQDRLVALDFGVDIAYLGTSEES